MSHLKQINKIDPMSLGKILCILHIFIGAIIGGIFSIVILLPNTAHKTGITPTITAALIAFTIISTVYGLIGWVTGVASAFIYNFVAKKFGGLKIELK